jgi:nucleoside-diphosphate-sugar epimerase
MADKGLVLVTGGSGYIAGFCIGQLIGEGWRVRTTVRSLAREAEVRATLSKLVDLGDKLDFVAADLNADAGWPEAVAGCDHVLHVASPLPSSNPRDDDELVRPARDGALRVLKAARDARVKRVVMTASTAAVAYGHGKRSGPFTEADWSNETDRKDTSAYERSKTIAERAVWAWMKAEGGALELVTIGPGAVLGPVLGADFSASIEIVRKLLEGSVPGLPNFGWPLVDVRDIADLHYRAMLSDKAAGERFIGAGDFWWMPQIAQVLRDKRPAISKKVPKGRLPDWLVRIAANFDPIIKERLFELGRSRPVSSEKARRVLGWTPRSNEEAILATADSLAAEKLF